MLVKNITYLQEYSHLMIKVLHQLLSSFICNPPSLNGSWMYPSEKLEICHDCTFHSSSALQTFQESRFCLEKKSNPISPREKKSCCLSTNHSPKRKKSSNCGQGALVNMLYYLELIKKTHWLTLFTSMIDSEWHFSFNTHRDVHLAIFLPKSINFIVWVNYIT